MVRNFCELKQKFIEREKFILDSLCSIFEMREKFSDFLLKVRNFAGNLDILQNIGCYLQENFVYLFSITSDSYYL